MEKNLSNFDWAEEAAPKEKIYFFIILVLVVVTFARWFWMPTQHKTKRMQSEFKGVTLQIETLKKLEQLQINESRKVTEKRSNYTSKMGQRFMNLLAKGVPVRQEAISKFVSDATTPDRLQSVTLSQLNFKSASLKSNYAIIPFDMELVGTFQSIMNYVNTLENVDVLMTVDNISMSSDKGKRGILTAKLNSSLYVLPEPGMFVKTPPEEPPVSTESANFTQDMVPLRANPPPAMTAPVTTPAGVP